MMYNLDEFDRIISIGNRHGHVTVIEQPEEELLALTENDRQFIKGTLFGIGVGVGLMVLMMVVMACI